ncbi:hypothetical protein C4K68_16550 [Pokkaliibacter plantistimulans]|uniref:HNH nuclease domain-containing protein n=2 Tax=Pseudomonadota TaxID=1224 RepID=A0A2S5KPM8_9PROT|nr:hypothetical protein C4K68_16550 [Pokkaliibacter plantistimulans]
MLNYKGYRTGSQKKTIFGDFDIAEFLSSYSTLFRIMPEREAMVEMGGYDDGWEDVSKNYRESKSWQCEECKVSLLQNKRLLHTHHINGVKRDNKLSNLKALCLDCHRKQPKHDYMRVTHSDMQTIVRLRREQSLLNKSNWSDAFRMADKSVEGILFHYQKSGQQCPYVGYELTNEKNEVVGELELAWPAFKTGIAINHEIIEKANKLGWKVRSVGEEIRLMSNTKTWS